LKKVYLIFIVLFIIVLTPKISLSNNYNWPDANNYVFPEYEVKIWRDFCNSLDEHAFKNDKELKSFIINFSFDISSYKEKLLLATIINKIRRTVRKNMSRIFKDGEIDKFIKTHENSPNYNDASILKKFLAWTFLTYTPSDRQLMTQEDCDNCFKRRDALLDDIAKNEPRYAPLALYLKMVADSGVVTKPTLEAVQKKNNTLNEYYIKFPDTEFAAAATVEIAAQYYYIKDYTKTIELSNQIINNQKNFFMGNGDYYSLIYYSVISAYHSSGNKEMVKEIIKKYNKQSSNYESFIEGYQDYIDETK